MVSLARQIELDLGLGLRLVQSLGDLEDPRAGTKHFLSAKLAVVRKKLSVETGRCRGLVRCSPCLFK